jgi:hypothetical protein
MDQNYQTHSQQSEHPEVECGIYENRTKNHLIGVGPSVAEENHLSEQAWCLERVTCNGVENQEPDGNGQPADDAYIGAFSHRRVGIVQHGKPPERL